MKKDRIITGLLIAIVYIAVFLLSVYIHPICFDIFIFLLAVGGVYEMTKAVSKIISEPIFVLNLIQVVVGFAAFWFTEYYFKSSALAMSAFFISLFVMVIVTVIVTACSKTLVKGNALSTVFVMVYPSAFLMFSVGINYFMSPEVDITVLASLPYRNAGIALMFLVPAFTDMFAYQIGSALKGKKLCPTISPNKTVSGAIGGLFGGISGAMIVALLTFLAVHFKVNIFGLAMLTDGWLSTILNFVALGLFGSVFDQAGDLLASFVKRRAGIKDYSNLLPGHGGVLDRIDGFILCGVFYFIYFSFMNLILL